MDIGHQIELEVAAEAVKYDIDISFPFGQLRYDQIWDVNGKLLKIQIKKSSLNKTKNGITFANRTARSSYDKNEIDAVVTIWENQLYFIPFNNINSSHPKTLMFSLTKEQVNSKIQCNWAEDFTIEKQLNVEKI